MRLAYQRGLCALIAFSIFGLDQWTKAIMLDLLQHQNSSIPVFSWFHWHLVWNQGISFGLFHGYPYTSILLLGATGLMILGCMWWTWRCENFFERCLWSMIVGAALGNWWDRYRFGAVVDFIDWFYGTYHWPAFNVADAFLTCCASVLFLRHLFSEGNPFKNKG